MRINNNSGIGRAITAAGGQVPLAKQLGITQQAVQQWYSQGFVPASRAKQVATLTGVPLSALLSLAALQQIRDLSAAL
jgi:hypothetical protein